MTGRASRGREGRSRVRSLQVPVTPQCGGRLEPGRLTVLLADLLTSLTSVCCLVTISPQSQRLCFLFKGSLCVCARICRHAVLCSRNRFSCSPANDLLSPMAGQRAEPGLIDSCEKGPRWLLLQESASQADCNKSR